MTNSITPITSDQSTLTPFVKKGIIIASIGGILFGYDLGVVSSALPQLSKAFELNSSQQTMVVSFIYLGGGLGAALGGSLCDRSGRRKAIILTDIIFIIGAIILFTSSTLVQILIGRFVVGFAVATSGIADVAYLHEISPIKWRGAIISVNEACISMGFMISYLLGYLISISSPDDGWRWMFGIGSLIAVIQLFGMMFMPESPVWLKENGRIQEAEYIMQLIHQGSDLPSECPEDNTFHGVHTNDSTRLSPVDSKLKYMTLQNECIEHQNKFEHFMLESKSDLEESSRARNFIPEVLSEFAFYRRQCIIAVLLSVMSQFCGHPNVLNFAPEIFTQIGFEADHASLVATLLLGTVKMMVTCFVIWKIETYGRKFLLLLGVKLISISLFLLFIAFWGYQDDVVMSVGIKIAAVLGVFGVAAGYACSFGPMTWLIVSELFPSTIRGRALGASTIVTYISAFAVSFTFLNTQEMFGPSAPYGVYFTLCIFTLLFSKMAVPETRGKDPKAIDLQLSEMKFWS